jgi:hypothetical protein
MPQQHPLAVHPSFSCFISYFIESFNSLLDLIHLWEQATSSLATYNQLAIIANTQLTMACHACFKLLDLVGHTGAVEPWEGLGAAMVASWGHDFVMSLIAMTISAELPGKLVVAALSEGSDHSFTAWEPLHKGEYSSEEEEDNGKEEDNNEDPGIPIDVDLNLPLRESVPPPSVASSSRAPALMPAASLHSLCSQASAQFSSAAHSSSSNVDSPLSAVSQGSKKCSKSFFSLSFIL